MKRKKLTDSFGKRIKIYTVKLPPVSDRKNAKISYVVAYENQTTWGMYRGKGSPKKCREIY